MAHSTVNAAIATTNKAAQITRDLTPKFVKKKMLAPAKHFGEWGLNQVLDNKYARFAADKTNDLINKTRSGTVFSFDASKKPTKGGVWNKISDIGSNVDNITKVMIIIIGLLFFIIFWWCFDKLHLDKKNCKKLDKLYDTFPHLSTINVDNEKFKKNLRDYYIKTAYNCCASGNYKNDFVNLCALKHCIKQGARCLDFEIYSVKNLPVVAISSTDEYSVKESYNTVDFGKAMETISVYAFNGSTCPNPNDPLIINLRIMSNITAIHDAIATALYNVLSERLLGRGFSYENNGQNIGSVSIISLMGKIVIMVDKANPLFTSSTLNEYVNIAGNAPFLRSLRYRDVLYTPDKDELVFFNQQNMTICLPDISANNKNKISSALAMDNGCQFIAMSFQNFDENMQYYTEYFDDAGTAFVLRPDRFRYFPVYIDKPATADPALSYAPQKHNPLGPNGPPSLTYSF